MPVTDNLVPCTDMCMQAVFCSSLCPFTLHMFRVYFYYGKCFGCPGTLVLSLCRVANAFYTCGFSSSYAQNLYGFRRFQGLYATSGSINHLPPMESFHFRTNELGHAYRVMATATSDLDPQYRTCFENLDTQLELISSFPESVFEYLQSLSTQVVKALAGTCVPSR